MHCSGSAALPPACSTCRQAAASAVALALAAACPPVGVVGPHDQVHLGHAPQQRLALLRRHTPVQREQKTAEWHSVGGCQACCSAANLLPSRMQGCLRRSGRCHRSTTSDSQQQQPSRAAAAAHPATTIFRSPMCCRLRLACRPSAEYSLSSAFSRMLPGGGRGGCSAAQERKGRQHGSREPPLPATAAASSKRLPQS